MVLPLYKQIRRELFDFLLAAPNVAGDDGSVTGFAVQSGTLDKASKQTFPVAVLSLIRRQAEDFLLSNSDDQKGREALQFVLSIAEEISGDVKVERIKKCKFLNTMSPKKNKPR